MAAAFETNLALLEHVNITLPGQRREDALTFYVDGLGFTVDPRPEQNGKGDRLMWLNCGLQQVHLPLVKGLARPEVFAGTIWMAVSDCSKLLERLSKITSRLDSSSTFSFSPTNDNGVSVICPFGTHMEFRPSQPLYDERQFKGHPSPTSPDALGITFLQVDIPMQASAAVANFYTELLGARTTLITHSDNSGNTVRVHISSGQYIDFCEVETPRPYDGYHICMYLHHGHFESAYRACEKSGLLFDNPRYEDKCSTWDLAMKFQQFRVMHVPPLGKSLAHLGFIQHYQGEGEKPVMSLELEVRSWDHPGNPIKPKN